MRNVIWLGLNWSGGLDRVASGLVQDESPTLERLTRYSHQASPGWQRLSPLESRVATVTGERITPEVSTPVTGTIMGQGPCATTLPSFTTEIVVWISFPNRPPVWLCVKRPPSGTTCEMGSMEQTGAS